METVKPNTQCPQQESHEAHDWILDTDEVENHRWCSGRPTEDLKPQQRPTAAVARALNAQVGDIITWGNETDPNAQYRWDGERWADLQVGDVCRNARDGSVMLWAGPVAGWRKPHVSQSDVDELAAVLWPGYTEAVDDQPNVDWYHDLAYRALEHGYTYTLRAPALSVTVYHFPRVPYQLGDPVDVTWSNGHTTRHTIEAIAPSGALSLRIRT